MAQHAESKRVNMDTALWGGCTWLTLETMAWGYPENPTLVEQRAAESLILGLEHLLPCSTCRPGISSIVAGNPPKNHVGSGEAFRQYVHWLHNQVNKKMGKPEVPYSDAKRTYDAAIMDPKKCGEAGMCSHEKPGAFAQLVAPFRRRDYYEPVVDIMGQNGSPYAGIMWLTGITMVLVIALIVVFFVMASAARRAGGVGGIAFVQDSIRDASQRGSSMRSRK